MHGSGSNAAAAAAQGGQGPGKWGLLAQHQGSYGPIYTVGGYGGGYGHSGGYGAHHHHHMGTPAKQLLSAQFMPEGLRQQLQQSNYLIQLQVRMGWLQGFLVHSVNRRSHHLHVGTSWIY
jgi:hypothetical protein